MRVPIPTAGCPLERDGCAPLLRVAISSPRHTKVVVEALLPESYFTLPTGVREAMAACGLPDELWVDGDAGPHPPPSDGPHPSNTSGRGSDPSAGSPHTRGQRRRRKVNSGIMFALRAGG